MFFLRHQKHSGQREQGHIVSTEGYCKDYLGGGWLVGWGGTEGERGGLYKDRDMCLDCHHKYLWSGRTLSTMELS